MGQIQSHRILCFSSELIYLSSFTWSQTLGMCCGRGSTPAHNGKAVCGWRAGVLVCSWSPSTVGIIFFFLKGLWTVISQKERKHCTEAQRLPLMFSLPCWPTTSSDVSHKGQICTTLSPLCCYWHLAQSLQRNLSLHTTYVLALVIALPSRWNPSTASCSLMEDTASFLGHILPVP